MNRTRTLSRLTFCLGLALLFLRSGPALAQDARMDQTFYLQPRIGITAYHGDLMEYDPNDDRTIFAFGVDDKFPFAVGLELGYQFSPGLGLGLNYLYGNYPGLTALPYTDDTGRHTLELLLRLMPGAGSSVAPYLLLGAHATFGATEVAPAIIVGVGGALPDATVIAANTEAGGPSYGPVLGLGLDFALSQRMSLFLEAKGNLAYPDEGFDGWPENANRADDDRGFDLFGFLGTGLRFNLSTPYVPASVLTMDCVATTVEDEPITFNASVAESTQPVEYEWNFGDGTTAEGLTASHSYADPGTYTITFTARGPRGDVDTRTCAVNVTRACVPTEIVTLNGNPAAPDVREVVRFSSNVRGDTPVTYQWDFGDGSTGTGANPEHAYAEPGTYTVRLSVSNACGTDEQTMTVNVRRPEISLPTELNSVYFGQSSSTLDREATDRLAENVELMRQYPEACIRILGYAAPDESNPQRLSEQRARAVEQYYIRNGIPASRLLVRGMGVDETCNAKEGRMRCRRADSIPTRCDELDR